MDGAVPLAVLTLLSLISAQIVPVLTETDRTEYVADIIKGLWSCQLKSVSAFQTNKISCPAYFDGLLCWPSAPVGTEVTHVCPSYSRRTLPGPRSMSFSEPSPMKYDEFGEDDDGDASKEERGQITRRCADGGIWNRVENESVGNNRSSSSNCFPLRFQYLTEEEMNEVVSVVESLPVSSYEDLVSEEAFDECIQNVLAQPFLPKGVLHCKRTFDGWGCWNDTMAGDTAVIDCPSFIPGFVSTRKAHKVCSSDGTWFRHPDTNRTWSNYTTCVDREDLMFRQYINSIYIGGYSLSAVALFVSLVIFYYFKSLKCTRITIHKNLFISFIVNNIMWIVWYTEVVANPSVMLHNKLSCQVLHVMVHYFMVTNYFWMFCEGLYLHTVLVIAFVSEDTIVKGFYFVGWGIPLILILLYATLRGTSPSHREFVVSLPVTYFSAYSECMTRLITSCWIQESVFKWIISGPVCLSLLLNLLFLINIVRVLVTKLRAVNSPDANQTKKAARATLILIPLLGLHYFLTPFRPEPQSSGEAIYETASAIVTSLQGLCVAFLFCFLNGEVTAALRRKYNLTRLSRSTGRRATCNMATSISVERLPMETGGSVKKPRSSPKSETNSN